MDLIVSLRDQYEATFHYYLMTGSFLLVSACLIKDSTCKLFKPNQVKLLIFAFLLISGFSWVTSVTNLRNSEDFSALTDPVELWERKHLHSKLQRDVYIQGFSTFCLFILLTFPKYYQIYIETAKAYQRKIEDLNRDKKK
jgi:hypothetical protein